MKHYVNASKEINAVNFGNYLAAEGLVDACIEGYIRKFEVTNNNLFPNSNDFVLSNIFFFA